MWWIIITSAFLSNCFMIQFPEGQDGRITRVPSCKWKWRKIVQRKLFRRLLFKNLRLLSPLQFSIFIWSNSWANFQEGGPNRLNMNQIQVQRETPTCNGRKQGFCLHWPEGEGRRLHQRNWRRTSESWDPSLNEKNWSCVPAISTG